MPVFRAKVFVCTGCKKMISYSPDQLGTTITCPRCGDKVSLPQADALPSQGADSLPPALPSEKKTHRRWPCCLIVGLGGCFSVLLLIIVFGVVGAFAVTHLQIPDKLRGLCEPLISRGLLPATAPEPATYAGTDISITVTKIAKECPLIYQSALKQTSPTETPVYCVTVKISNNGGSPVQYRTWRALEDASDFQRAATLSDDGGSLLGMVSFGRSTWPVGALQQADISPGSNVSDILMFQCGAETKGDCLLTLPGENLGSGGKLRFRIPRDTIQ